MRSLLITGCIFAASFGAQPTVAEADCMCGIGEAPLSRLASPAIVDGPQSEAAEGENAASRPVDEISSSAEWMQVAMLPAAQRAEHEQKNILWCQSDDGHRCDPAHSDASFSELVPPSPGTLWRFRLPRVQSRRVTFIRVENTAGPEGLPFLIERPPATR